MDDAPTLKTLSPAELAEARYETACEAEASRTDLHVRPFEEAGRRADQWTAGKTAFEVKSLFVRCVFGKRPKSPEPPGPDESWRG